MSCLRNNGLIAMFMPNLNSAKLSIRDQITLFSSVRDFLKNGFNLSEAFDFCRLAHPELTKPIQQINQKMAQGNNFADGIKPLVAFRLYCQIRIAEFHGNLIQTLDAVSRFLRMKKRQKSKLMGIMMYPIFLLILLIGIIIAIRVLVAPQIHDLDSGRQHYSSLWILFILIPVVVISYGLWRYYHEQNRVWQINMWLKVPLLGPIYQSYYSYYLSSNLSLMMSCGMDLQRIVHFMAGFKSNRLIQDLSHDVQRLINHGGELDRLRLKYHFLSKELMMFINAGDTTDVLAQKLRAYSKLEFKLMIKRSSRIISLLQPIMFLLIGLIITGTYLSMLLPMYDSIKGVY